MHRHEFLHQNAAHLPVRTRPFLESIAAGEHGMAEEVFVLYDRARDGAFALVEVVSTPQELLIEELFVEPQPAFVAEDAPLRELEAAPGFSMPWEALGGKKTFVSLAIALPVIATLLLVLTDLAALPVIAAAVAAGALIIGARRIDRAYSLRLGPTLRSGSRFAMTTGAIFAVLFVTLNFGAFWERARYFVQGGSTNASSEPARLLEQLLPGEDLNGEPTDPVGQPTTAATPPAPEVDLRANLRSRNEQLRFDDFAVAPPDDRLIIPKLGKNIPIIHTPDTALLSQDWGTLEKQIQTDLRKGVVHYPGTAYPGEKGNVFITGHSSYYPWDPGRYKSVFVVLDQLVVGDQVVLYSRGEKYVYVAKHIMVVPPSRTDVLSQPTERSMLTLMTCTPTGTALNRLIVQFDQISPDPALNRTPTSNDGSRITNLAA